MKRTTEYVGLDVHQATTVTTVREETGRVIARTILPTEAAPIVDWFRGMRGSVHVAFEEGTQAQWLHDLLVPVVDRVPVCNRRGQSSQGNKADQVDADVLSDLLRRGALRAVYHGSHERATLKEPARTYQHLVEDSTRVMQRLKALFRARGITTAGSAVYQRPRRGQWLGQLASAGVRFRAEALSAELEVLQDLRPKAKAAMLAEARRDPAWAVLRTIPFLGPVRVALLLATLQTPWRFPTKRHLWAYAGLAVVTRTSAEYELDGQRAVRRRFTAILGPLAPATVLLEASTESEWVARHLESLGLTVIVADPNYAPMYATRARRVKTDRRDARTLAEACRLGAYRPAHRLSDARRHVRAELAVRDALVRTRTRYIALAKSLVRRDGLRVADSESERVAERIAALELSPTLAGELAPLFALLAPLNAEIAAADRRIAQLTAADPVVALLTTAPGVGPITASALVATIDDITRFRSAHEFEAYLGVVPGERSSGEKRRVGRITKAGNARVRWLLVEAAWRIARSRSEETGALRAWALGIA